MSEYEAASLLAQWWGVVVSSAAVIVAFGFGLLTYITSQRSIDAQERSSLALNSPNEFVEAFERGLRGEPAVKWSLKHRDNMRWDLWNDGNAAAFQVEIAGATDQDDKRIVRREVPSTITPGELATFLLNSYMGAAAVPTLVVGWRAEPDGSPVMQRIPIVK